MEHGILCPNCLSHMAEGEAVCPYCGRTFAGINPAGALPYGTLLGGRYTIGKYILADGEGLLYHAVENTASVRVIVKEYYPVTLSNARWPDGHIEPKEGSEVLFKTNRMDFADLYRSIQRITPAAGLVAVLDVIEANNTAYAVQELAQGMPLEQYLSLRGGLLNAEEACTLMQPVLEGVAAMHKAGLVHRGIAPDNIFISDGGTARLAGYATLALRTAGSELKPLLYEGYSAPEQYSAAEFEGRYTDVYGLGAVFYRLLTGSAPLSAAQRKVADSQRSAHSTQGGAPMHLSNVLEAAMRLAPAERIQHVPELMGALKSPDEANAAIRRGRKRARKRMQPMDPRVVLAGALMVVAMLACLLLWTVFSTGVGRDPRPSQSAPSTPQSPQEALVTVPDFARMAFAQVEQNQEYMANFSFALEEEFSSEIPAGGVIRQEPLAGSQLGAGDSKLIRLFVSKGPQLTCMPNIIGFTKENASAELNSAGIRFSMVTLPNDGQYVSDCVVKASVQPGEEFDVSTQIITVYIASDRAIQPPEPAPEPPQETPNPQEQPPASTEASAG